MKFFKSLIIALLTISFSLVHSVIINHYKNTKDLEETGKKFAQNVGFSDTTEKIRYTGAIIAKDCILSFVKDPEKIKAWQFSSGKQNSFTNLITVKEFTIIKSNEQGKLVAFKLISDIPNCQPLRVNLLADEILEVLSEDRKELPKIIGYGKNIDHKTLKPKGNISLKAGQTYYKAKKIDKQRLYCEFGKLDYQNSFLYYSVLGPDDYSGLLVMKIDGAWTLLGIAEQPGKSKEKEFYNRSCHFLRLSTLTETERFYLSSFAPNRRYQVSDWTITLPQKIEDTKITQGIMLLNKRYHDPKECAVVVFTLEQSKCGTKLTLKEGKYAYISKQTKEIIYLDQPQPFEANLKEYTKGLKFCALSKLPENCQLKIKVDDPKQVMLFLGKNYFNNESSNNNQSPINLNQNTINNNIQDNQVQLDNNQWIDLDLPMLVALFLIIAYFAY